MALRKKIPLHELGKEVKGVFTKVRKGYAVVIALVSSVLLFFGMIEFLPDFSRFGAIIFVLNLLIALWLMYDKYLLIGIDTLNEIKKNNTALAIVLLAIAIVLHALITGF